MVIKINHMKKVLLLFVALFVSILVNAQTDVSVGPKIGYQTSKLSFKGTSIKQDFKNDMTFGVFTRFTFPKFILQPELLYSTNGRSAIQVPVYFGYKLLDNKNFKFRANAGPILFYNVQKSVTNRLTFGGSLGLGVDIWRFTFDLNYSLGTVFDNSYLITTSKANQNIFTLTMGFKLRY